MADVLLTWEMGAGLGHLTQLLPVGRRLWDAGHRVTVAVQNMEAAARTVARAFPEGADRLSVVQGVAWAPPQNPDARSVPTPTLADVLRLFNWNNVDLLREMAGKWDALVADVKPDLVIADFSPTLRLAVEGRVPMLVIGTGYSVPPAGRPLPPIRPWDTAVPPFARANEAELLFAANRVRHHRQGRCVDHFSDLFAGDATFVLTIPQFDPYGAHRGGASLPPYNVTPVAPGQPAHTRPGDEAFLYLEHNHPALEPALAALGRQPLRVSAYIGGRRPGQPLPALPDNVRVNEGLVDFAELLPRLRLILHHGGLGTTYAALMAATPQVLFPLNLEHGITSRAATSLGCADLIQANLPMTVDAVAAAIGRALSPQRAAAARAAAAAVVRDAPGTAQGSLERILAAAQALLPAAAVSG